MLARESWALNWFRNLWFISRFLNLLLFLVSIKSIAGASLLNQPFRRMNRVSGLRLWFERIIYVKGNKSFNFIILLWIIQFWINSQISIATWNAIRHIIHLLYIYWNLFIISKMNILINCLLTVLCWNTSTLLILVCNSQLLVWLL